MAQALAQFTMVGGPYTFPNPASHFVISESTVPGLQWSPVITPRSFTSSEAGKLVYTGAPSLVCRLRMQMTTRILGDTPTECIYFLSRNSSVFAPSHFARETQWSFTGHHSINIERLFSINNSDVLAVACLRNTGHALEISAFSLFVDPVADVDVPDVSLVAAGEEWIGLESEVNFGILSSRLSETVTYLGQQIRAVFDPQPVIIDPNTGATFISTEPLLSLRPSDLVTPPKQKDVPIVARGIVYSAGEVTPRGYDWVDVHLTRVVA